MRYITLIALVALLVACDRGGEKQLPPNAVGTIKVVEGFSGPEAVRYDPELDVYFVSNFNGEVSGDANGFVSKVSTEGEIDVLEFMRGSERWPLHGPRGMARAACTSMSADSGSRMQMVCTCLTGKPVNSLDLSTCLLSSRTL